MEKKSLLFAALFIAAPAWAMRSTPRLLAKMSDDQFRSLVQSIHQPEFVELLNKTPKDISDLGKLEKELTQSEAANSSRSLFFRKLAQKSYAVAKGIDRVSAAGGSVLGLAGILCLLQDPMDYPTLLVVSGKLMGLSFVGSHVIRLCVTLPSAFVCDRYEAKDKNNPQFVHATKNLEALRGLTARAMAMELADEGNIKTKN